MKVVIVEDVRREDMADIFTSLPLSMASAKMHSMPHIQWGDFSE
jgi:hypothetical protein